MLQILPLQDEMPFVVASQISPSGMTLAGKYGIGIISLGSMSTQGLMTLPTQWSFAEDAAKKHGTAVSRADWRVLLAARRNPRRSASGAEHGWHNEYSGAPCAPVSRIGGAGVEPSRGAGNTPNGRTIEPERCGSIGTIDS